LYASGACWERFLGDPIEGKRVTDRSGSSLALLDSLMYSDKSLFTSIYLHLALGEVM
jgi:hypothetical protein